MDALVEVLVPIDTAEPSAGGWDLTARADVADGLVAGPVDLVRPGPGGLVTFAEAVASVGTDHTTVRVDAAPWPPQPGDLLRIEARLPAAALQQLTLDLARSGIGLDVAPWDLSELASGRDADGPVLRRIAEAARVSEEEARRWVVWAWSEPGRHAGRTVAVSESMAGWRAAGAPAGVGAAILTDREALADFRDFGDREGEREVLLRMAGLERGRGDPHAALPWLGAARAIRDGADVALEVARALEEERRWDAADAAWALAVEASDTPRDALVAWGDALQERHRPDPAVTRYEAALEADGTDPYDLHVRIAIAELGRPGRVGEARRRAEQALASAPDRGRRARAHALLARIEDRAGRLDAWKSHLDEAGALYAEEGDVSGQAIVSIGRGDLAAAQARPREALEHWEAAVELARRAGRPALLADALDRVAVGHLAFGRLDEAALPATEALEVAAAEPFSRARALEVLAGIAHGRGDYGEAVALREQALAIAREWQDPWAIASTLNNLGVQLLDMGQCDRAVVSFEESAVFASSAEDLDVGTAAAGNLAWCRSELGDVDGAVSAGRAGLALAESHGLVGRAVDLRVLLGVALRRGGRHDDARGELAAALSRAGEAGLVFSVIQARTQLGISAWQTRDFDDAQRWLEAAAGEARRVRSATALWEPAFYLGRSRRDAGDPDGAVASYTESIEAIERMKASLEGARESQGRLQEHRGDVYRELVDLLTATGRAEDAFGVVARMKAHELGGLVAPVLPRTVDDEGILETIDDLRAEEAELERLLRGELARPAAEQDASRIEEWLDRLDAVRKRFDEYVGDLQAEHPDLAERLQIAPADLYKLQATLAPGEVFVEPVVLPDRVALFVVRPGAAALLHAEVQVDEERVDELVRRMRESLQQPARPWGGVRGMRAVPAKSSPSDDASLAAVELHDLLITPIQGALSGADTLIVSPSGRLRYVPFAALYDGERYLVESYAIATLTRSGAMMQHATLSRGSPLLALGDPDGSLPGAVAEVTALSKAWGKGVTRVHLGSAATKAHLRAIDPEIRVVHLATHGYLLDEDPRRSYILLAGDGERSKLTFDEIGNLPLSNVRLAVLSACETALGDRGQGVEIAGLAQQFEQRGTTSVVATLWAVSDEGTGVLMRGFYGQLGRRGVSRAEALRTAQLALLADPELAHPYYWAPFVLIGDWR